MYLLRLVTPHFVAGLEIANQHVHHAAPIVGYMKGWSLVKVMIYVRDKNWSSSLVLDNAANKHLLETRTVNMTMTPGRVKCREPGCTEPVLWRDKGFPESPHVRYYCGTHVVKWHNAGSCEPYAEALSPAPCPRPG